MPFACLGIYFAPCPKKVQWEGSRLSARTARSPGSPVYMVWDGRAGKQNHHNAKSQPTDALKRLQSTKGPSALWCEGTMGVAGEMNLSLLFSLFSLSLLSCVCIIPPWVLCLSHLLIHSANRWHWDKYKGKKKLCVCFPCSEKAYNWKN